MSTVEPYPASWYAASRNADTAYPELREAIDTEICIVGAGFTGVSTALTLAERGHRVVVLEQNRVGWGASGRNGGQVIGGFSGEGKLLKAAGEEVADRVWEIGWRGNDIISERVEKYAIDCDLKWGYMDVALKPRHLRDFESYHEELQRRGFGDDAQLVGRGAMRDFIGSDAYIGGLVNKRSGHLHPLNLCLGEARAAAGLGVHFYEGTEVTGIEHGERPRVTTPRGEVRCDRLLLAGNAYLSPRLAGLAGLIFPAGSYIIATEPLTEQEAADVSPRDMAFCDPNYVLDYFRLSADRRMLFGGRCNYSGRVPRDIGADIAPRMRKIFPQLVDKRIDYAWGGNIGIVVNRVPLIGRLTPNLYHAMGYSGHGVNMSHATGEIIADAMAGNTETLELFERVRHTRIPFGRALGSQLVALGMLYFRGRDLL